MFCLIVERMVVHRQEAHDSMVGYLTDFDSRLFDGKNVSTAILHIKAIVRALFDEHLPKNVVQGVLKGFKKVSNEDFRELCATNIAMTGSTIFHTQLVSMTRHKQLFSILDDLAVKYAELLQAELWNGVGHKWSTFITLTSSRTHDGTNDTLLEYSEARALTASKGQLLPFSK